MKETKKETLLVDVYYCDICKEKIERLKSCKICSKHLCIDHQEWDNRENEDYPDIYCQKCWTIGDSYREQMLELEEEMYAKIESLDKEWIQKALEDKT